MEEFGLSEEEEVKTVREGEITLPYRWVVGPAGVRFFQGLKEKKILGTKCHKCGRVLVPGRKFCPRCFVELFDWVEVSDEGTIRTYAFVNYSFVGQPRDPPYIVATIDLDGADTGFSHYVMGIDFSDPEKVKDQVKIGMRVKAVWKEKREGAITDIDYFKPVT